MVENKKVSISDLFKKLAISFGIGWAIIMIFQAYIWVQGGTWAAIPFGKYDIALSQILGWGAIFSMIAKWVIDRKPKS